MIADTYASHMLKILLPYTKITALEMLSSFVSITDRQLHLILFHSRVSRYSSALLLSEFLAQICKVVTAGKQRSKIASFHLIPTCKTSCFQYHIRASDLRSLILTRHFASTWYVRSHEHVIMKHRI